MNRPDPLNRDPITEEPGAHPIGTGVGAGSGALTGAALGAAGGPLGAAAGAVVGAVVGGLAGRAAAEVINPTAEDNHWRDAYEDEPYYKTGASYDDYGPAYRAAVEGRRRHAGSFDNAEPALAADWERRRGGSRLSWDEARPATRAAWDRLDRDAKGTSTTPASGLPD